MIPPSNLDSIISQWRNDLQIAPNFSFWNIDPPRQPRFAPFPQELNPILSQVLYQMGIEQLYSHQVQAWDCIQKKENVVISTATASGKSLCFQLPVFDHLLQHSESRTLFLYPTKALANDQKEKIEEFLSAIHKLRSPNHSQFQVNVYDGDTPSHRRPSIRKFSQLILSNPDMLHTGILPHHTNWADFFRSLEFVIIDEIHIYRGVFGSHLANLIRRLKRIAAFYGSFPQFILTSATISNARDHACRLIEAPVTLIDEDGAPHGRKHFILYNPPLINEELGIRKGAMGEAARIAQDFLQNQVQTILFTRTRRTVEQTLRCLQDQNRSLAGVIRGYRSGYLPAERREIELSLRDGKTRLVVATNALELGIDIGGMEAVILLGYPGTIAATRQQAGRAGRKRNSSAAILVGSANPLDQYILQHPEYLFTRSVEKALINPDNLLILLQHIRCAAFELPFRIDDGFGELSSTVIRAYLEVLEQMGEIHLSGDRYFWTATQYPAADVSLRSASPDTILLQIKDDNHTTTIGEVDRASAVWMVHPGAVYLHEARSYVVQSLDLENGIAILTSEEPDYYTETDQQTEVTPIEIIDASVAMGGTKTFGEILVRTQVIGYRRLQWISQQHMASLPLELPASELRTTAYWLTISDETVETLSSLALWTNSPNQYGPGWDKQRVLARQRDRFTCQVCGIREENKQHHVHHKIPFRQFASSLEANQLNNLITLCPSCHRKVETNVRMRSGLAGLAYVLQQLSPLQLMCDINDLGVHFDVQSPLSDGRPVVVLFDVVPGGIGLSKALYEISQDLLLEAFDHINQCPCTEGCPSCVGVSGSNASGGKMETQALLAILCGSDPRMVR